MMIDSETAAGGICHQRGINKNIPPQWVMYINVANVSVSLEKVLALGGKLLHESKKPDGHTICNCRRSCGGRFGLGSLS